MANVKISELPAATVPLAGTELVPVVQGSVTEKTTAQAIANLAGTVVTAGKALTVTNSLTLSGTDGSTLNVGTGGTLGTAAYTAATAYDASGTATAAVSGHAALQTGVHGISITAAKTLSSTNTLTLAGTDGSTLNVGTGGTLGTAAFTASTAYEASGAIATHAALQTGVHGISITAGKTLSASNSITLSGTDSTTMTFPPASASVGYLNIPQNSQSAAYTTVLADAGKHLYHPSTDANARTFTIDSNANVAYPIGTALTFVNMTSQVVTIAITSDTMYLSSAGTTGSRSLAQYGVATAMKITSTTWIISGNGLT